MQKKVLERKFLSPKPCFSSIGNDRLCFILNDNEFEMVMAKKLLIKDTIPFDEETECFDKTFEWENTECVGYLGNEAEETAIQILHGVGLCAKKYFQFENEKCQRINNKDDKNSNPVERNISVKRGFY